MSETNLKLTFLNRTAFTLIHQELYDEALKILQTCLESEGSNSKVLANLAVCYAMKGETENAKKYISAAKFNNNLRAPRKDIEGFIDFCEAIITTRESNFDKAEKLLEESKKKSKNISKYLKSSLLIESLSRQEPEAKKVFKQ